MNYKRRLETPRVVLEATHPDHAGGMWEAIEPSLPELRKWMPWATEATYEATYQYTTVAARGWDTGTNFPFTIFHEDQVAGSVGIEGFNPRTYSVSIGYWLHSARVGKGLTTEAASAAIEFAFLELGSHRIELRASPGNLASIRVADKLGFRREGLLRDAGRGEDGYHDLYTFGLLESDPHPKFHLIETD